MLTLDQFKEARSVLQGVITKTNLVHSGYFSELCGNQVYLKPENLQVTGAYKIRGAYYKTSKLTEEQKAHGLITASAGNHAQGVAYAAKKFGIPATIVMPQAAPIAKVQATEGYGAKVVLAGDCYDAAYTRAREICDSEGSTFLHPYNDPEVIAGQGTLGVEILGDLPTVDMIVVPAGGGGLLAGVASAVKQLNPRVKVYGVQAEGANAIARSFREKKLITTETASTIADGIAVKSPGDITVDIINQYVDGVVTVSDKEISSAILLLMERCKQIVEPAGATPLAAVLGGELDVEGRNVVCVLSGGNIDVSFIQSIIEQGLVARDRRLKFIAKLVDRPGSLVQLLNVLADAGANILTVEHDKLMLGLNPNETYVRVACEVGGKAHGSMVISELKNHGYQVELDELK